MRTADSKGTGIDPTIPIQKVDLIPKLPPVKLPTPQHVCCPPGMTCPPEVPPCNGAYCTEGSYCPPGTPKAYDVKTPDFHVPIVKLFPIPAGVCCPADFHWCSQMSVPICPAQPLLGNVKIIKITLVEPQGAQTVVYDAKSQTRTLPMWDTPHEVIAIVNVVNQSQTAFDVSVRVFGEDVGTGNATVAGKDVVDIQTTPFHVLHVLGTQIRSKSSSSNALKPSWFGLSDDNVEDELSIESPPQDTTTPTQPTQPTQPISTPAPPQQDGLFGIPWWMILVALAVLGIVLFVILSRHKTTTQDLSVSLDTKGPG